MDFADLFDAATGTAVHLDCVHLGAACGRVRLREGTSSIHERMHQLSLFRQIEDQSLSRHDYGRLLCALHAFHQTIGSGLRQSRYTASSSAWERVERVRSDLNYVGCTWPKSALDWAPASDAEALGALYVAEGSMLGGRVIARQLDYLFDGEEGRQFFRGRRDDKKRWRAVLDLIAEMDGNAPFIAAMVLGAERAFALFEQCVEKHA